jgi:hypothetical protein
MSTLDDLMLSLFADTTTCAGADVERWARRSRRFRHFLDQHASKIRAKVRSAKTEPALHDVRAELEAAALLLSDDRFSVTYEGFRASGDRGPDFTVVFRSNLRFHLEIRRIRSRDAEAAGKELSAERLQSVLLDKTGQVQTGSINLLWLSVASDLSVDAVSQAHRTLLRAAETKDEAVFIRHRYASSADFLRQYGWLSGVLIWNAADIRLWPNPLARRPVPRELELALTRLSALSGH